MKHLKFRKDVTKNEEDNDLSKSISARQVFSSFRRSNEGVLIINNLLRKQLYLCPYCKCSLNKTSYEVDHIIPLVLIPSWKSYLVTSESNLMVLCECCNKSKSAKVEGSYNLFFHREQVKYGPLFSSNIYKDYTQMIKKLSRNKYENIDLQQRWNRDVIILNCPLNLVIEERLIIEVEVIDE